MKIRECHQTYRLAAIVSLVLSSVLFTTACSAVTQQTSSKEKSQETQSSDTAPELAPADFAKIQSAMPALNSTNHLRPPKRRAR